MSVTTADNNPSQDCTHPCNQTELSYQFQRSWGKNVAISHLRSVCKKEGLHINNLKKKRLNIHLFFSFLLSCSCFFGLFLQIISKITSIKRKIVQEYF